MKQNVNKRYAPREEISPLKIGSVSSLDSLVKLIKGGSVVEASTSGFLVNIKRGDLVPQSLRTNLTLDELVGTRVLIVLPQLNLEISGRIARTRFLGKEGFELGVDYSEDSPEYWRECLLDLLPKPGELED